MEFLGRRYDTGAAVAVAYENGRIVALSPAADAPHLPWISPGWCDLQINGYGGQEFSSSALTPDKVAAIVRQCHAQGVTTLCPTVTTNSNSVMEASLRVLAAAIDASPLVRASVAGVHLEGPYLSPHDGPRGAHARQYCQAPDWDQFSRFQEAASGHIRLITLSPEYDEAPAFIDRATASGVVVAIGHLAATSDQIARAVDAGARLSTHLGNGAHLSLPRHPNYLWDQLAEDRLSASLIADGHHLPPAVVKSFVRAKSPERIILVSDLSGMAGLPSGRYQTELCDLEILPSGRIVVAGQTQLLAAASAPLSDGIANTIRFAGVSLRRAVDMASTQPAALLGLSRHRLEVGGAANLSLFEFDASTASIAVRQTVVAGASVYSAT